MSRPPGRSRSSQARSAAASSAMCSRTSKAQTRSKVAGPSSSRSPQTTRPPLGSMRSRAFAQAIGSGSTPV